MAVGLLPTPSDEQAMLLEASCRFMDDSVPIAAVRRRCDAVGDEATDGDEAADAGYRTAGADLGWFGLLADESSGGGSASGNGVLDAALIAAERGARLRPGPFTGHSVVVDTLGATGANPPLLESLVKGTGWATWALDADRSCRLHRRGDRWYLDGALDAVAEVGRCDWLLLATGTSDGAAQALVALGSPGADVRPLTGLDLTRTWCRVAFEDVEVEVVGRPGAASDRLVARQAPLAAVLSAADAVGAMHADLTLAVQYAKDRIAFGRPIGSFQAIKHLLADTSLWLEMAKGIVAAAATALGSGDPNGAELAHAAKAFVAERGVDLAQNCFQVFGGIGYTWDHDQHLFLRRITAEGASFGSAAWHRERLLDEAGVSR